MLRHNQDEYSFFLSAKKAIAFLASLMLFMVFFTSASTAQQQEKKTRSIATTDSSFFGKPSEKFSPQGETPTKIEEKKRDSIPHITLSTYEYIVGDTSESVSFRLYVRNTSDSLVVIDRVEPSCGCILATIQKSYARKDHDGEIYIAFMTSRMNDWQPFTVDVYTSINSKEPLRLYIRKHKQE